MFMRLISCCVVVAALSACASVENVSQLDGRLYSRVNLNRYPLTISRVDGAQVPTWQPVWVEPGTHSLTLDAPPIPGFSDPVRQVVTFTVAPCTRYHLAAQRESRLSKAWTFVVDHQEPVPGCVAGKSADGVVPALKTKQASALITTLS
jgi:hypothetical protein